MESIQLREEDKMRIIINDEILLEKKYQDLTKKDIDNLIRIASMLSRTNSEEEDYNFLKSVLGLDDGFADRIDFMSKLEDNKLSFTKYINWFKNNSENVKKCRNKNSVTEKPKSEVVDSIDYNRVKNIFNTVFTGTKIASIKILSDKRKVAIKNLYNKMSKQMESKCDIYEFYETYFAMIRDCKKSNLTTGWLNISSNSWFLPTLDYFLKDKCFINLIEKYDS